MDLYADDTQIRLQLVLRDLTGAPMLAVAKEDVGVRLVLDSGSPVDPTLVDGTAGTFIANSWVELGNGVYQLCLADGILLPNTRNTLRLLVAGRYYFDTLNTILQPVAGGGSETYVLTLTDATSSPAIAAACYVTSDEIGGVRVTGTNYTNDLGQVSFALDPGTYYVWANHPKVTFPQPITITVDDV